MNMLRFVLVFLILLEFEVGEASNCGKLEARPKESPVLLEARLYFYGNDFRRLEHKASGGIFETVAMRYYEEVRSSQQNLSVLKIFRSKKEDSGTYRVVCFSGLYSTEAELIIKEFPPSPPVFGNTESIGSCVNCISGWETVQQSVTCSTWNGTHPVSIEIRKDNIVVPGLRYKYAIMTESIGEVVITPSAKDHNAELLCLVKNVASSQPLITTTSIYIKKTPAAPIIGSTTSIEDIPSTISCTSNGGRPAPSMNFRYNHTQYSPARTDIRVIDAFFSESVLKKVFTRYDNRKQVMCCTKVSEDSLEQCMNKALQVSFPPISAKLDKLHDISKSPGPTQQVIRCRVGESFPSSGIEWGGLDNINHTISDSYNRQGQFGSVMKEQNVNMLLYPNDNGKEITCMAKNRKFPSARPMASMVLNVTYAPFVKIVPSGNITVHHGDDVSILCDVDGNPPSSVAWYNGTELVREMYKGHGLSNSLTLDLINISYSVPATFTCVADNGIGKPKRMNITVIVTDKSTDFLKGSEDQGSSSGMVAGILCVLVLLVVLGIVIALVAVRRKRKHEVRLHSDVLQIRIEERQPSISPQVEEPVYNNINNMSMLDNIEESNTGDKIPANNDSEAPKELVYAELELHDDVIKPRIVIKPTTPETEYVAIDFTKKASILSDDGECGQ